MQEARCNNLSICTSTFFYILKHGEENEEAVELQEKLEQKCIEKDLKDFFTVTLNVQNNRDSLLKLRRQL